MNATKNCNTYYTLPFENPLLETSQSAVFGPLLWDFC